MAKDEETEGKDAEKGGKGKLIIIAVPLVLLIAGVACFFLLRPKDESGPEALPEPTPGAVVTLDPITINLAGAHFLKLGLALQPTATATEVDGSKALDLAISQFSGATVDELSTAKGREQAKRELVARVKLAYLPEGTDLAAAVGEPNEEAKSTKSSGKRETPQATSTSEEEETISGEEALKLTSKLTVQPDVYDVYLTEFVMQ